MTDPLIELDTTRLQANPGGQASVRVTVRNLDYRVQGYRLEVLPPEVAAWAEVPPPILNLDVDQEGSGVIVFSPPGGGNLPGGAVPFAIKATSVVDPTGSAVAEGHLEIGQVFGLTSKITPVTSSGRWRSKHRVSYTNWGNAPVHLRLTASDPDERLGFLIAPESLDLPVGGTAEARVKVRTRHPVLRGNTERLPFKVVGDPFQLAAPAGVPAGVNPNQQVLDGGFTQKPIISRGIAMFTVMALVLAIAGAAFALTRGGKDGGGGDGSPPDQPTGFEAYKATPTSIWLKWTAERSGVAGYTVNLYDDTCAGEPPPGPPVSMDVPAAENSLEYTELKSRTTYCFTIVALNDEDAKSTPTPGVTGTTLPPANSTLGASGTPTVTPEGTSLRLNWDRVDGADHYEISRYASMESEEVLQSYPTEGEGVEYLVPDLPPGSTQCFAVTALLEDGTPSKTSSPRGCGEVSTGETTDGNGPTDGESVAPPAEDAYTVIVFNPTQGVAPLESMAARRDLFRDNGLDTAAIWSSDSLVTPFAPYDGTYMLIAGTGTLAEAVADCQAFNSDPDLAGEADLLCGDATSPGGALVQLGPFDEGAVEVMPAG